jgi:DNA gyrase subunit A
MNMGEGDKLLSVESAAADAELLLHTVQGKAIRFSADDVRVTKRVAGGVRAIRLDDGDAVVRGAVAPRGSQIVVFTSVGVGRRTELSDFPLQGRDGSGVKSIRISEKTGPVVAVFRVDERASIEAVDNAGRAIVLEVRDLPLQDRTRQGNVAAEGIKQAVALPRR